MHKHNKIMIALAGLSFTTSAFYVAQLPTWMTTDGPPVLPAVGAGCITPGSSIQQSLAVSSSGDVFAGTDRNSDPNCQYVGGIFMLQQKENKWVNISGSGDTQIAKEGQGIRGITLSPDEKFIYASVDFNHSSSGIFVAKNDGKGIWTHLSNGLESNKSTRALATIPNGEKYDLYAGTSNSIDPNICPPNACGLFAYSFEKEQWNNVLPNVYVRSITPTNEGNIYVGTEASNGVPGGVWRSKDAGKTWQASPLAGLNIDNTTGVRTVASACNHVFAGVYGLDNAPSIFHSDNHGETWTQLAHSPSLNIYALQIQANQDCSEYVIYAATSEKGVYRSTDQGQTWYSYNKGLNQPQALNARSLVLKTNQNTGSSSLWLGTAGAGVYKLEQ